VEVQRKKFKGKRKAMKKSTDDMGVGISLKPFRAEISVALKSNGIPQKPFRAVIFFFANANK